MSRWLRCQRRLRTSTVGKTAVLPLVLPIVVATAALCVLLASAPVVQAQEVPAWPPRTQERSLYLPLVCGPAPQPAAEYAVLGWNDLGMHCYNADFSDLAVLPPYNTLWTQIIQRGAPPVIVTTGVTATYRLHRQHLLGGQIQLLDLRQPALWRQPARQRRLDRAGAGRRVRAQGGSFRRRRHPVDRVQRLGAHHARSLSTGLDQPLGAGWASAGQQHRRGAGFHRDALRQLPQRWRRRGHRHRQGGDQHPDACTTRKTPTSIRRAHGQPHGPPPGALRRVPRLERSGRAGRRRGAQPVQGHPPQTPGRDSPDD